MALDAMSEDSDEALLARIDRLREAASAVNKYRSLVTSYCTSPEDEALLARIARGERRAAEVLSLRLAPRVYVHAARLLGDRVEAEDVTQEALLKLWRIAPHWQTGRARITTWLYRVTANLCIDRMPKRRMTRRVCSIRTASC